MHWMEDVAQVRTCWGEDVGQGRRCYVDYVGQVGKERLKSV
jgi:hypothetical protein